MRKINCGIASVSFRKNSVEEIINAVKESGLTCIEWGSDVHARPYDEEALNKINYLQENANITTSSYGTYFEIGKTEFSELEGYIFAAKKLGTDILRLWCGTKGSLEYTAEEKETVFEIARKAAKIAEKHNVFLCLECHPNTLTDKKEAALEIMEAVNSPFFKMYWQPNQFETLEENIAYIRLLKPYITHIHVFNREGHEVFPLRDNPFKWQTFLSKLGMEEMTLLLEFMPDNKIESLNEEANALIDIVKEFEK